MICARRNACVSVYDYATAVDRRFESERIPFNKLNICPWHSWIARQTPTLKVEGSNPFGQANNQRGNAEGVPPLVVRLPVWYKEEPLHIAKQ